MDYLIQIYIICSKYPSYNTKNHSINMKLLYVSFVLLTFAHYMMVVIKYIKNLKNKNQKAQQTNY